MLQCLWLVRVQVVHSPAVDSDFNSDRALRVYAGLVQWKGGPVAGTPAALGAEMASGIPSAARNGHLRVADGYDRDRSPLYYLLGSAGALLFSSKNPQPQPQPQPSSSSSLPLPLPLSFALLAMLPQIFCGVMLGASLWYVARRLYGNAGGFMALGLYCFSPAMIIGAADVRSSGEMGGVWGAFGSVFTAIAVAHTLYAPREVVVWNWRRILLLGLSIALMIGNQFSLAFLLLAILPLMMWVAPVRRKAVVAIWAAAVAVAAVLLLASYCFQPQLFWAGMEHANWVDFNAPASGSLNTYVGLLREIFSGSPSLMIALLVAVTTYAAWKRARYFGNTGPLLIASLCACIMGGAVDFPGQGFQLVTIVFMFVFVSGVLADLLQSDYGPLATAGLWGLVVLSAVGNVWRLARFS